MQHDRYITFCGLECAERAEELVQRICSLAHEKENDNRFWSLFSAKVDRPGGPDALFLVHSYIFYMRELMENHEDTRGLQMLDAIENDCC